MLYRAVFDVPVSLHDFVCLAIGTWPGAGWRLGRGDAEANETEDSFSGPAGSGAFRATGVCCDVGRTTLLIVWQPV